LEPKERIIAGARELFFRHGTKTITMEDIAKHLGMSKKTLYQFFANKNDLVDSMMLQQLNDHESDCSLMASESTNVIEEIFALMNYMGNFFSQINPNLFYDLQKYHKSSWDLFRKFKDDYIVKMVEESLLKGIKQGLVRADLDIKTIARMRVKQVELGFDPQLYPPDKFKIADVQQALLDHFLHGVCTLKGHKLINKYKSITEEE
jgi:TetR/AcrR family transcriptional regulator, cholesterol catabolism regulator